MKTDNVNNDQVWTRLWSETRRVSANDSFSNVVYHAILEQIGNLKGKTILEVGSGTGKISLCLAQRGANVIMVDYTTEALKLSRCLSLELNARGIWIKGSAFKLPLRGETVDLAFSSGVWEHFDKEGRQVGFNEMVRCVKPGGIIILVTPYRRNIIYNWNRLLSMHLGYWKYGYEEPLDKRDMRQFLMPPNEIYTAGFFNNLHSLYVPPFDRLGVLISGAIRRLIGRERFYRWNRKKWLPGPRIFGVFQKPSA